MLKKLRGKGGWVFMSEILILAALGIAIGHPKWQAGKWGTKDGVVGSESQYPKSSGTIVEILGENWGI